LTKLNFGCIIVVNQTFKKVLFQVIV